MFGMTIIFMVLAAPTFGSALVYAMSGFGFAVLAAPLFLLFRDPTGGKPRLGADHQDGRPLSAQAAGSGRVLRAWPPQRA
jgi:hypothetical protein